MPALSENESVTDEGVLREDVGNKRTKSSDSPDEIVRRENLQVNLFRLLIIIIQVVAAITTSSLIYRGISSINRSKFVSSYHAVAERIVDAALTDFLLKYTTVRALTASVEALLRGLSPLNTTLDKVEWEEMSIAPRLALNSPLVSWSPLIQSDEDRVVFENYAQTQTFKHGPFPPCFHCNGDPAQGFLNTEKVIFVSGIGQVTCGFSQTAGRRGIMPPPVCTSSMETLNDLGCVCGDIPEGAQVPTNIIEKPNFIIGSDVNSPVPFGQPPYLPTWQTASLGAEPTLMFDQMSDPVRRVTVEEIIADGIPSVSGMVETGDNDASFYLMYPLRQMNKIVGIVSMEMAWSTYFAGVFPPKADLVIFVVENTCGDRYTFKIDLTTETLTLLGTADLHDSRFDEYGVGTAFADFIVVLGRVSPIQLPPDYNPKCGYRYMVYPTEEFYDEFVTNEPFVYAILSAG